MLYERNTDYSTDFIYLLSNPATVKEYTNAIAWDFVKEKCAICEAAENSGLTSSEIAGLVD